MTDELKQKWNDRYRDLAHIPEAVFVLQENTHLLPKNGVALDMACGRGGNALLLAKHGMETHAWDLSDIAIESLDNMATKQGLKIHTAVRDVEKYPPDRGQFDVIVVSYFLERGIVKDLFEALKPGGLLFYQTFAREKVSERGPGNPDYRLAKNELLDLFSGMRVILYREEGLVGDITKGYRDEAMLIAQKT